MALWSPAKFKEKAVKVQLTSSNVSTIQKKEAFPKRSQKKTKKAKILGTIENARKPDS